MSSQIGSLNFGKWIFFYTITKPKLMLKCHNTNQEFPKAIRAKPTWI